MQKVKKTNIAWTTKEKTFFAVGFMEAFIIEFTPAFPEKGTFIDTGV